MLQPHLLCNMNIIVLTPLTGLLINRYNVHALNAKMLYNSEVMAVLMGKLLLPCIGHLRVFRLYLGGQYMQRKP